MGVGDASVIDLELIGVIISFGIAEDLDAPILWYSGMVARCSGGRDLENLARNRLYELSKL